MKNQTPVTYEHLGIVLSALVIIFTIVSAVLFWTGTTPPGNQIRSIVCYNPDGSGPVWEGCEGALAKVKCFNQDKGNSDNSEVKCPFWP